MVHVKHAYNIVFCIRRVWFYVQCCNRHNIYFIAAFILFYCTLNQALSIKLCYLLSVYVYPAILNNVVDDVVLMMRCCLMMMMMIMMMCLKMSNTRNLVQRIMQRFRVKPCIFTNFIAKSKHLLKPCECVVL